MFGIFHQSRKTLSQAQQTTRRASKEGIGQDKESGPCEGHGNIGIICSIQERRQRTHNHTTETKSTKKENTQCILMPTYP